jgi:hypothetical protein
MSIRSTHPHQDGKKKKKNRKVKQIKRNIKIKEQRDREHHDDEKNELKEVVS